MDPRHGRLPRFTDAGGNARVGALRRRAVSAPAAGADWSVTVPGGETWRVLFARAQLTTSAVVANRAVQPTIADQAAEVYRGADSIVQAAGIATVYSFTAVGGVTSPAGGTGVVTVPLPSLYLPAGYQLAVATANRDVGDQWSAVELLIETLWDFDSQEAPGHRGHHPDLDIHLEVDRAPYQSGH